MIDESHNLRNREGKRYQAIQEYILENESKVILLFATPYNKTFLDLSNQLRLFVDETEDLGIRPVGFASLRKKRKHENHKSSVLSDCVAAVVTPMAKNLELY